MSMDKVFGIAGSALAAQLVRMNTTASNLANASNTAATEEVHIRPSERCLELYSKIRPSEIRLATLAPYKL